MNDLELRVIINAVTTGLQTGVNNAVNQINTMGGRMVSGIRSGIGSVTALLTSMPVLIGGAFVSAMTAAAIGTARSFDKINASIKTATKGLENEAIPALKDFAKTTPFDLAQVSEAFVKLVNFGLTPSEQALRSYGNTSSALGKDLSQMVEAVADAVTGEFERLKEFGIKSKVEGDHVIFTFQGVKTSVKNNAADIEKYLISLGEVNFAGAMDDRAKTLDGALSNLGDSWNNLVLTITQNGFSDFIAEQARRATEALDGISKYIESGIIQANIDVLKASFSGFGHDVEQSMNTLTQIIGNNFAQWESSGTSAIRNLINEFQEFVNYSRTIIQITTVEIASMWDRVKTYTDSSLNSMRKPLEAQKEQIEAINKARENSIDTIFDENFANKVAYQDAIDASDAIQRSLDKEAAAHKKNNQERLAKFGIGGTPQNSPDIAAPKSGSGSRGSQSAPKAEVSDIGRFEDDLTAQKLAFERQNLNLEYSKAQELKYWQDLIASYSGNSKTLADMKKRAANVELQLLRETAQQKAEAEKQAAETAKALALEEIDARETAATAQVQVQIDEAEQLLALGDISNGDLLARQKVFEEERYQIALKAARDRAALIDGDDTVGKAKAFNDQKQLGQKHAADMRAINHRMALDSKQQFTEAFAPIKSAFGSTINGVIQGTTTLKQGLRNAFQSIAVSYAGSLASMALDSAAHWAWELLGFGAKETAKTGIKTISETAQTGATIAGVAARTSAEEAGHLESIAMGVWAGLKRIGNMAVEAAAGAYNAMVGIPYVGPIIAPIAAAVSFAAVMAFGGLMSSAGGDWQVGDDRLNMVHKNETILPASIAAPLRDMIAKNSSGSTYTIPGQTLAMANPATSGQLTTAANTIAAQLAAGQSQQKSAKKSGTPVVLNTHGGDFVHKNDVVSLLRRENRNFRIV